jgi:hypothetical protein
MKSRPIAIVGISYVLISTALAADSPEKATWRVASYSID